MNLTRYVDDLRHQVLAATELGGDDIRALAERLMAPVEAATRLVLLDVLSDAADEITGELAPGSVEVRLRQGDPEFVVTTPAAVPPVAVGDAGPTTAASGAAPSTSAPGPDPDEGATARVTLRLPEQTKARIEQAAADGGVSVNAWLVRVTTDALGDSPRPRPTPRSVVGDHVTGWVR